MKKTNTIHSGFLFLRGTVAHIRWLNRHSSFRGEGWRVKQSLGRMYWLCWWLRDVVAENKELKFYRVIDAPYISLLSLSDKILSQFGLIMKTVLVHLLLDKGLSHTYRFKNVLPSGLMGEVLTLQFKLLNIVVLCLEEPLNTIYLIYTFI